MIILFNCDSILYIYIYTQWSNDLCVKIRITIMFGDIDVFFMYQETFAFGGKVLFC
jgi:hypothetical protein